MATIVSKTAADGSPRYQVVIRLAGHRPIKRTFRRKTTASRWAARTETQMREEGVVPNAADDRRTVADLLDRYVRDDVGSGPGRAAPVLTPAAPLMLRELSCSGFLP